MSSTMGYDLGFHTYNMVFGRVGSGDGERRTIKVTDALRIGRWYQIAGTYDGGVAKLQAGA